MALRVEVLRGSVVESVHPINACAVDIDGALVGESEPGVANWPLFMRSAAKPFQATVAAAGGVIEALGLTEEHLAVGCASHDGSPEPVRLVREILAAAGLEDFAVHTGDDGQGGLIKHQCSGNHALALAACVVQGWPVDSYLDVDHPAQRAMNDAVATACGVRPELAADNCGMPTHRVPLGAMARAFSRLGVGWDGVQGLDRVAQAMRAHPYAVRQRGEIDSELIARSGGRFVAKVAAEAAVGVGSAEGVGIAVRVVDGSMRAWGPAAMAAIQRWIGEQFDDSMLESLAYRQLLDGAGRPIGSMRATWTER